jgi:hypothetical protein
VPNPQPQRQKITLTLERKETTATGAFLDALLSLTESDPEFAEARPHLEGFRDKLRAALDAPPVEERVEYRVVVDQVGGIVELGVEPLADCRARAAAIATGAEVHRFFIQSRTVSTTPWVDVEEGK